MYEETICSWKVLKETSFICCLMGHKLQLRIINCNYEHKNKKKQKKNSPFG